MAAPVLPAQLKTEMAKRHHRLSHYLWHAIRTNWERLDQDQKKFIIAIDPAWAPPRPVKDNLGRTIGANNSGEDFLFMHREMIKQANEILASVGDAAYPKIEGWKKLPEPNNRDFPVLQLPDNLYSTSKTDDYFRSTIKPWEQLYKSKKYLKSVTLGELGTDIEFTIHDAMHLRWATPSAIGIRPRVPITEEIDVTWDNVNYDFLGDTYSSHVHPTFWKIHGWIDNRIEDWRKANQVININWIGTWVGPQQHLNPHNHDHHFMVVDRSLRENVASNDHSDKMIKIAKMLSHLKFNGFIDLEK